MTQIPEIKRILKAVKNEIPGSFQIDYLRCLLICETIYGNTIIDLLSLRECHIDAFHLRFAIN